MGGHISVESQLGYGSRFRFDLELPLGPDAETQQTDPKRAFDLLRDGLAGLGRPLRLLLAEDNPTNQFVVTRLLKEFPVQIDIANDGREAVASAMRVAYDVICMDMRMPEMDGLEATRAIRHQRGPSRDVPIVAMTANAFLEDMQACHAAGMTDFVAKPISKDRLVEAILHAMSRPG
jgi:CheY-like chemotaxis protein